MLLKKIIRKVGSSVEQLVFIEENGNEKRCLRRNVEPIVVTCETIQNNLDCVYKLPRTRECMYRLNTKEYTNVEIEVRK